MEKAQAQQDETASYKEYTPSEIYSSSDPPPAYMKMRQANIVQVARIAAYTLVAVSFILGSFILASSYVTASLSCQEYQPYPQEYMEERVPRFQSLVGEPLESEETKHQQLESADQHAEEKDNKVDESKKDEEESQQQSDQDRSQEDPELKLKFPIQLDLDALTGALLEGNSKSKMNCVVEKQKSEELMNKEQRELISFGLDLAGLDPGLKHITGERLAIVCETSRESPKESQVNQVVLPFPLPGLHPMVQRPPMPPHFMPPQQSMGPRHPFHLPFMRPFQPFVPQQRPQPRQTVEEIPVLVLEENDNKLQNLLEMQRPHHPQIQNLLELQRPQHPQIQNLLEFQRPQHPQIQNLLELQRPPHPQIQNILELHRAAPHVQNIVELPLRGPSPSIQNLIEIPETKVMPMMHPSLPERRHLPPWARPEGQEPVVQIQAMPAHMVRAHMQPRPVRMESEAIQVEARPIHVEARPIQMEPRPMHMDSRPVQMEPRPIHLESRPVQIEPRPIQLEGRQPEGRSLSMEGRALPDVPSDTVNPPPPPFDMQPEPSRPHFVQPRSVRSIDSVLHRRDKRERRCACDCAC